MNKPDETRMAIVEGINKLSAIKKFSDIRISDICTESGVSRATFYRSFYNALDVVYWLWDKCNSDSLYKMGNPYGWRQAHTLQFQLVYDYKDLFIPAFEESEFTFFTTYGAQSVLREITRNITEVYNYVMSDKEQFELQYFNYGCSYMFSKWAQNGMTQSPEEMADYFGRLVPPFLKNLIGE